MLVGGTAVVGGMEVPHLDEAVVRVAVQLARGGPLGQELVAPGLVFGRLAQQRLEQAPRALGQAGVLSGRPGGPHLLDEPREVSAMGQRANFLRCHPNLPAPLRLAAVSPPSRDAAILAR